MNLEDYSKYLGLSYTMELADLISSHKNLRDAAIANNKLWQDALQKARLRGRDEGYRAVTEGEFISVIVLRGMTVGEVVDLVNSL